MRTTPRPQRAIGIVTFMSGFLVFAPPIAKADVTFTWHSDSGTAVSGSFTSDSAALTNPSNPAQTDFTSVSFTTAATGQLVFDQFIFSSNLGFNSQGVPLTPNGFIGFGSSQSSIDDVIFGLGTSWNVTNGEIVGSDSDDIAGSGHWTIQTTAVVPEPSTAILAVFGAVSGIAYGLVRKRQSRRRQGEARHPLPTE